MLDRPHIPRIAGTTLRDGSYYWLVTTATSSEMRFGEPISPDAIRIDVFEIDGELVRQTIVRSVGSNGNRVAVRPQGRGWQVYDATGDNFTGASRRGGEETEQEHVHPARTVVWRGSCAPVPLQSRPPADSTSHALRSRYCGRRMSAIGGKPEEICSG
jgi:hypothetical protein